MSTQSPPVHRFRAPCRRAFTFLEVLLVLGISALFIVCIFGFFASRGIEPLKSPPRPPAAEKATPAPAKPEPVQAPPVVPVVPVPPAPPEPPEPAPAAPAEPAP